MSSLKLAQAINARGVYSIGQLDNKTSTRLYDKKSVDSVISLLLRPATENGQTKVLSLEKLQELQSKLALISGKDSQGQEDVGNFGEVKYILSFRKKKSKRYLILSALTFLYHSKPCYKSNWLHFKIPNWILF